MLFPFSSPSWNGLCQFGHGRGSLPGVKTQQSPGFHFCEFIEASVLSALHWYYILSGPRLSFAPFTTPEALLSFHTWSRVLTYLWTDPYIVMDLHVKNPGKHFYLNRGGIFCSAHFRPRSGFWNAENCTKINLKPPPHTSWNRIVLHGLSFSGISGWFSLRQFEAGGLQMWLYQRRSVFSHCTSSLKRSDTLSLAFTWSEACLQTVRKRLEDPRVNFVLLLFTEMISVLFFVLFLRGGPIIPPTTWESC